MMDIYQEQEEMFNSLNYLPYSMFKRGRKYVEFATGGWSDNEELVSQLERTIAWKLSLVEWKRGGYYKFEIFKKVK
jgi:hypothetical protein